MSRLYIHLMLLAACLALVGCGEDSAVVWQAHVKSPNGHYQVNVATIQQGGPGNAALYTLVKLSQREDGDGIDIVDLSHNRMDEIAGGPVKVVWLDDANLRIEYVASSHVNFQAIKAAAVAIETLPMSK